MKLKSLPFFGFFIGFFIISELSLFSPSLQEFILSNIVLSGMSKGGYLFDFLHPLISLPLNPYTEFPLIFLGAIAGSRLKDLYGWRAISACIFEIALVSELFAAFLFRFFPEKILHTGLPHLSLLFLFLTLFIDQNRKTETISPMAFLFACLVRLGGDPLSIGFDTVSIFLVYMYAVGFFSLRSFRALSLFEARIENALKPLKYHPIIASEADFIEMIMRKNARKESLTRLENFRLQAIIRKRTATR